MLKPALLALALLTPGTAMAAEWQFEDLGVPIAYIDNGVAQFQFACRGGDLAMGYWVRAPHHRVAGADAINLALTPDAPEKAGFTAETNTSFAQDMPLIHADGSSVIVRGPVARQWARLAQKAKLSLRVAYVHKTAKGTLEVFDPNSFDATGSSSAINKVLSRCS